MLQQRSNYNAINVQLLSRKKIGDFMPVQFYISLGCGKNARLGQNSGVLETWCWGR